MFKTITKILAVFVALVSMVAVTPKAFASYQINGASNDCNTVSIGNYTTSSGISDPCWTLTSTTANVGDVINVALYYHNSGDAAAPSVSFKLNDPENQTISQNGTVSFTGSILVNGSVVKTGTVTANVSGGPSHLVLGNIMRYDRTASANVAVSNGPSLFTSSGLNYGTLNTGWENQGLIKVSFTVVADNGTCTTCTTNGQQPSVTTNQVTNLDANNGNVTLNGMFNSNGYATTTSFQYQLNGGSWINVGSTSRGVSNGSINFPLTGLAGGTYTYEAVATNAYGTVYGAPMTFTIYGGNNNTQYCPAGYYGTYPNCYPNNNNTQYCQSGYYGTYPNCYPNVVTQYCQSGYYGTYPNCYPNTAVNNQPSSVSTLGTISVGGTVAVVDGYYSSNSCSVNTYFNYGTTQSLGQTTGAVNRGVGSGSMAQALQNLNQNTTYYYQAVGQNCSGTTSGTIRSFTTSGTTTNDTTITRYVTVNTGNGGGSSFIKLTIDNHRDVVRSSTNTAYDISWTNLTGTTLNNLVLEVNFPAQMTITDTDRGAIETNKSAVVYQISSLTAHETGNMTISGTVNSGLKDGDPVVAQAVMAFENPKTTATENAIAYDADTFSLATGSVLGASIFGLGFLPNTLAGWLIIILIILIIVLIARHFWNRPTNNVIVHAPAAPAPVAQPTIITGAPTGEYTVYQPTPKQ